MTHRLIASIFLAVCATATHAADRCEKLGYASIAADVVTTEVALNQDDIKETNTVYGDDPSTAVLLAGGALRALIVRYVGGSDVPWLNCVFASLTFGVAGNNIAVIQEKRERRVPYAMIGATIPLW